MYAIIESLLYFLQTVLGLYSWVVIASVVMSWLVNFGVINLHNRFVYMIYDLVNRLTEPVFQRVRRVIPPIGGFDLSPIVVLLAIMLVERVVSNVRFDMARAAVAAAF